MVPSTPILVGGAVENGPSGVEKLAAVGSTPRRAVVVVAVVVTSIVEVTVEAEDAAEDMTA
jgi:hypothetical protein